MMPTVDQQLYGDFGGGCASDGRCSMMTPYPNQQFAFATTPTMQYDV